MSSAVASGDPVKDQIAFHTCRTDHPAIDNMRIREATADLRKNFDERHREHNDDLERLTKQLREAERDQAEAMAAAEHHHERSENQEQELSQLRRTLTTTKRLHEEAVHFHFCLI